MDRLKEKLVNLKHSSWLITYIWYLINKPRYSFKNKKIMHGAEKRASGVLYDQYEWIHQLKQSHVGDRCFIVATGPSLTIADLEKLYGEFTFGMNSICKIYSQTSWRPTVYAIQDENVYKSMEADILKWYAGQNNIWISDLIANNFKVPGNYRQFPLNRAYHDNELELRKFFVQFSDDCYSIVYDGYSITYSLIQFAIYMGFSEIYLLGADCSYKLGEKNHFVESGFIDKYAHCSYDRMMSGYIKAKEYSDKNNIKIVNCTRGGMLELFPRCTLEEVLLSSPNSSTYMKEKGEFLYE